MRNGNVIRVSSGNGPCKKFHICSPAPENYLVKVVGVDRILKNDIRRIKQGKTAYYRSNKHNSRLLHSHLLGKRKQKSKSKGYEHAEPV